MLSCSGGLGNKPVLHVEAVRHFFANVELHGSACFEDPIGDIDAVVAKGVIFSHNDMGLRQAAQRSRIGIPGTS